MDCPVSLSYDMEDLGLEWGGHESQGQLITGNLNIQLIQIKFVAFSLINENSVDILTIFDPLPSNNNNYAKNK